MRKRVSQPINRAVKCKLPAKPIEKDPIAELISLLITTDKKRFNIQNKTSISDNKGGRIYL